MSIRQEKFGSLLQQELAAIFNQYRSEMFGNAFITISKVMVSPDLGHAKVYISMLQIRDPKEMLNIINLQSKEIRKILAAKIRKQARIVPDIHFFVDDSLDYVFKMEKVFAELKKQDPKKEE
jgi:ribosome-binding factor A